MTLLNGLSLLTVLTIQSNHETVIAGASYSDNCRWRALLMMPNGRILVSTQDIFPSEESALIVMKAVIKAAVEYTTTTPQP